MVAGPTPNQTLNLTAAASRLLRVQRLSSSDQTLIRDPWNEHNKAAFPKGYAGKDVSGIDDVMLEADVTGCLTSFLGRGNSNLFRQRFWVFPIITLVT